MNKHDVEYRMYSTLKIFAKFLMSFFRITQVMIFGNDVYVRRQFET